MFTFMTNSMPPPSNAPPLTPFSAPASSTSINTPGGSIFAASPLQVSPGGGGQQSRSSIPLKKRSLTNEANSSAGGGGLVKQISIEATSNTALAASNTNDLGISLNDWLKSRVLAVRRVTRQNISSSSHHHHHQHGGAGASATAVGTSDESNDTISVGGNDDEWQTSPHMTGVSPLFLDYTPAIIENTNGTLVTVTFTAVHGSTCAAGEDATSSSAAASSLVLSQSLPANLSMLPFHRYIS